MSVSIVPNPILTMLYLLLRKVSRADKKSRGRVRFYGDSCFLWGIYHYIAPLVKQYDTAARDNHGMSVGVC
jgi:hypothetical protein